MIYDCFVRQKKCRSILKHVLKRCDIRKSCRRPVVSLSHATKSYRVNRPLRMFGRKPSHIEFCFISRLNLGHKNEKRLGGGGGGGVVTDFVPEKKAREKCPNFDRWVIITRCSLLYSSVQNHKNNTLE